MGNTISVTRWFFLHKNCVKKWKSCAMMGFNHINKGSFMLNTEWIKIEKLKLWGWWKNSKQNNLNIPKGENKTHEVQWAFSDSLNNSLKVPSDIHKCNLIKNWFLIMNKSCAATTATPVLTCTSRFQKKHWQREEQFSNLSAGVTSSH